MQTLFEAASHIAQEIERTRQHLANLEQALEGLRPLVTIDAAATALPYSKSATVQTVSDVSEVQEALPARRKSAGSSRTKAGKPSKATRAPGIPKTGAGVWLAAMGRNKQPLDAIVGKVLSDLALGDNARAVIRNRAGAWLHSAVQSGTVTASTGKDGVKRYQAARGA